MNAKEAIEIRAEWPDHTEANAMADRALSICDELGLLEDLPEPINIRKENGVIETAVGDILIRESRWRQVYPEETPWEYTTAILMFSPLHVTDGGREITRLIRELVAAYKFLKASAKHWEGK